jgi:hypothetical protein
MQSEGIFHNGSNNQFDVVHVDTFFYILELNLQNLTLIKTSTQYILA